MIQEKNYDFLKRMREIFKPDRRDPEAVPDKNEIELDSSWKIVIPEGAGQIVRRAAADLQEYLFVSMNVSVSVIVKKGPGRKNKTILLIPKSFCTCDNPKPEKKGAFIVDAVRDDGIVLCGFDDRSILYGAIHLEDLMNYREAPFIPAGKKLREPLARMRSVHSGCSIDDFPDWQLNAIVHAGFNAIDVFVKNPDTTTKGYCNINDVIDRAASYGLDTVIYSYLKCYKHPDDPDAEEYFDRVFGNIFRSHPGAAAIHLVGESLSFPSKDPHTTGKPYQESVKDGIPDTRPSPGWYPCCDYPAFVKRVADAVHKVKPEAEVILNTYNWGYTPADVRKKFLEAIPRDITIHTTYDIFKLNKRGDLSCPVMDYSISAADPGFYFTSDAENAAALGFTHVRVTSNTAGASWDFGTVPYVPVPFRWAHRMLILKDYLFKCHVDSFYETHHYGWWPNPCNDLAKEIFFSDGETDVEKILLKTASRDYGRKAAPEIVAVWKIWSDSMDHYVGTNEDQYGPWRVGPSYPFIFQPNISRVMARKEIPFPAAPHAHFGGAIVRTLYMPYENANQSPGPLRYPAEIKELEKMLEMWDSGLASLAAAKDKIEAKKMRNYELLFALGKFIRNSIRTTLNMKHWWILNTKLQVPSDRETMLALLDQIEALAQREIENVKDTFDAVRTDSRIGWEPSMEYVCDEWHLNWKLRQMESMLGETAAYRKMIQL